jgi:hypothetical protein
MARIFARRNKNLISRVIQFHEGGVSGNVHSGFCLSIRHAGRHRRPFSVLTRDGSGFSGRPGKMACQMKNRSFLAMSQYDSLFQQPEHERISTKSPLADLPPVIGCLSLQTTWKALPVDVAMTTRPLWQRH